jgi:hypothetical protein
MHRERRYCIRLGAHINCTVAKEIAHAERAKILPG